ncbi:hypothetical protein L3Q82_015823, partial [Scortum barcoo]
MSGRDPFPSPKFENGFTLSGFRPPQRKAYNKPTHIAQTEEPWSRLYDTATLASSRRSVLHHESQAPNDSLDFHLKSVYDHHKDFFWPKNQILCQKETVSEDKRWLFEMLCWQQHYRNPVQPFLISHITLQETGKLKAGDAGEGTRERHQSVDQSTEVLHLQHQVKH